MGVNLRQPSRRPHFRVIERRQINGVLFGFYILICYHPVQRLGQFRRVHGQQFRARFREHIPRGVAVAVVREAVQRIQQTAPQPFVPFVFKAQLRGDCVRRLEAYSPNIVGETVRVFLHYFYAVLAVSFVNLRGVGRADIVALQKKHDVFDFLLFQPAFFNPVYPQLSDSRNFYQLFRRFFYDFQRIFPKTLDNPLGKFRPDSFHKAASQILFNTKNCSGKRFLDSLRGKLTPVFRVELPRAAKRQDAPDMNVRHRAHYGNQILKPP